MENKSEPRPRLFYPYCGHKLGFCLSPYGCIADDKDHCIWFKSKHPYTGQRPRCIYAGLGRKGTFKLKKGG